MPIQTRFLFVVSMDVDPAKEALFNEVYDREHIPYLLEVPGVRAVSRMKGRDFQVALGGAIVDKPHDGPRYVAMYEIDSPEVLSGAAWASAVEKGRWPGEVRPFTSNRRHQLLELR